MFSGTFVAVLNNRERTAGSFLLLSFIFFGMATRLATLLLRHVEVMVRYHLTDRIARERNGEVSSAWFTWPRIKALEFYRNDRAYLIICAKIDTCTRYFVNSRVGASNFGFSETVREGLKRVKWLRITDYARSGFPRSRNWLIYDCKLTCFVVCVFLERSKKV